MGITAEEGNLVLFPERTTNGAGNIAARYIDAGKDSIARRIKGKEGRGLHRQDFLINCQVWGGPLFTEMTKIRRSYTVTLEAPSPRERRGLYFKGRGREKDHNRRRANGEKARIERGDGEFRGFTSWQRGRRSRRRASCWERRRRWCPWCRSCLPPS